MSGLWLRKDQHSNCWIGSCDENYIAIGRHYKGGWEATARPLKKTIELSEWTRYRHEALWTLIELLQNILGVEVNFYDEAEIEKFLIKPKPVVDSFGGGPKYENPSRRRMKENLSRQCAQMALFNLQKERE